MAPEGRGRPGSEAGVLRGPGEGPSVARVHAALLGGKDSYAVDRAVVARLRLVTPGLELAARASREFMHRAVAFLAASGVNQFIDLGCGYPARPNAHEIAQHYNPAARVVYTDNDTSVLVHARALLGPYPGVGVTFGDARDVGALLSHPMLPRLIDLRRPVAVLMVHLLALLDDPHATRLLDTLRSALPGGSHLVLTHTTASVPTVGAGDALTEAASLYSGFVAPFRLRSIAAVNELLGDCELVPPGLCRADAWRPVDEDRGDAPVVAAVARLGVAGTYAGPGIAGQRAGEVMLET